MYLDLSFLFFFSSRRRHTRCSRDWSSDVCSSDLDSQHCRLLLLHAAEPVRRTISECIALAKAHEEETGKAPVLDPDFAEDVEEIRSEERRVGKECRSRWSPYH